MPTRPVVAIFQHHPHQGPGFLLHVLQDAGLRAELFDPDERSDRPADLRGFAGLVVLGSDHSVNEDRPWIHHERALVRQAVREGIPVIGHCFGSQLLAQALGARVQMLSQAPQVLPDMHATARRVYARWIEGVRQRQR